MFDNITRHFSLKGDDRLSIGTSLGEIELPEEKSVADPVDLNERDIDSIEIDDHAIIDDLIHADDDMDDTDYLDSDVEDESQSNHTENEENALQASVNVGDKNDTKDDPIDEILVLADDENTYSNEVEKPIKNINDPTDDDIEIV